MGNTAMKEYQPPSTREVEERRRVDEINAASVKEMASVCSLVLIAALLLVGANSLTGGSDLMVHRARDCSARASCGHLQGHCCPTDAGILLQCCNDLSGSNQFMWGVATSAFQTEGFLAEAGRRPSIWDQFTLPKFHHVENGDTPEPADKDYLYYGEKTLPLLEKLGVRHYGLSIAWGRILHSQTQEAPEGVENLEGIQHYRNVLDDLRNRGIEPVVTMWHWDTPKRIDDEFGGFLNRQFMPLFFEAYAKALFKHFGDLVMYWITMQEPLTVVRKGYTSPGVHAPGRCGDRQYCLYGNDDREPYLATHVMLLCHGRAFKAWRKFGSKGLIGVALRGEYLAPFESHSTVDSKAAQRCMEFGAAMFFDPIFFGRYPQSMVTSIGQRLPVFSLDELELVNGSHAGVFFLNYWSTRYVASSPSWSDLKDILPAVGQCGLACDGGCQYHERNSIGQEIGNKKDAMGHYSKGDGLRQYLNWISKRYKLESGLGINIIITGNGWADLDHATNTKALDDVDRCNYHREHIGNVSLAIHQDGVAIDGYFFWSLMDSFQWEKGYTIRYGISYVDYATQMRYPKLSYKWFQDNIAHLIDLPTDGWLPYCVDPNITKTTTRPPGGPGGFRPV